MTGIFANQFNFANAYNPVGLDTGTPSVGATLGKLKRPNEGDEPARVPSKNNNPSEDSAKAQARLTQSAGIAAGAGTAAVNANESQDSMNRLAHIEEAQPSIPVARGNWLSNIPDDVTIPAHSGADATPPPPDNNPLGGFGHWFAHTFDSARHGVASAADTVNSNLQNPGSAARKVLDFGDPFGGHEGGILGMINPVQAASSVVQPTNVYNPSRAPSGEISQGSPKIIQGQVENPSGISGARGALGRSAAYDNMHFGPQFYRGTSGPSSSGSSPWYDSIPDDLSSLGEDLLSFL